MGLPKEEVVRVHYVKTDRGGPLVRSPWLRHSTFGKHSVGKFPKPSQARRASYHTHGFPIGRFGKFPKRAVVRTCTRSKSRAAEGEVAAGGPYDMGLTKVVVKGNKPRPMRRTVLNLRQSEFVLCLFSFCSRGTNRESTCVSLSSNPFGSWSVGFNQMFMVCSRYGHGLYPVCTMFVLIPCY